MFSVHWREKRSGIIGPEERLPWGGTLALGFQHVLAMFGATVVAPLIMGFDPNLAILRVFVVGLNGGDLGACPSRPIVFVNWNCYQ
ncbi:MAG TPA: hypothetical protein VKB09_10850 [Thermomicrobiales bacterium]|nr:hypothetical protein [Thermomicrobiales bacterium]